MGAYPSSVLYVFHIALDGAPALPKASREESGTLSYIYSYEIADEAEELTI